MKKRLLKVMLAFSLTMGIVAVGCQEKKDPNTISKAELNQRIRFCKPQCVNFCKNLVGVCSDFLKEKKRTVDQRQCGIKCFQKCLKHPHAAGRRLVCANRAKSCEHFRNCNRCGQPTCPPKKNNTGKATPGQTPGQTKPAPTTPTSPTPGKDAKQPAQPITPTPTRNTTPPPR